MTQNGFFKRATVNGKKAAIYVEDGKTYLLSYTSKWDDGSKLQNGKGFTKFLHLESATVDREGEEFLQAIRYALIIDKNFADVAFEGEAGYERDVKPRNRKKSESGTETPTESNEEDSTETEDPTDNENRQNEPTGTPEPQQQQTPAFAPVVPNVNAMTAAFGMMFTGLQQQIAQSVMKDLEPTIKKVMAAANLQTRQIEVTSDKGTHKVDGVTCKEFETVLRLVNANIPVYMFGPAGCGKNVIAKQVAKALGLDFYFSNAVTQEYKLAGFIDANGTFHETEFYKAFTKGGLFMLDELDASIPEVLINLNAALANGYYDFPNGRVDAHRDFRVIAAGNTCGTGATIEYTGRYQMDASSLDRFAPMQISYDENVEKAICNNDNEVLEFIHNLRKAQEKTGIKFVLGYRAIERIATMSRMFDEEETLRLAIFNRLQIDELRILKRNMLISEDNKYMAAFSRICA